MHRVLQPLVHRKLQMENPCCNNVSKFNNDGTLLNIFLKKKRNSGSEFGKGTSLDFKSQNFPFHEFRECQKETFPLNLPNERPADVLESSRLEFQKDAHCHLYISDVSKLSLWCCSSAQASAQLPSAQGKKCRFQNQGMGSIVLMQQGMFAP